LVSRFLPVLFFSAFVAFAAGAKPQWVSRLNVDARHFKRLSDSLKTRGFRPVSMDMRGAPAHPSFSSSFVRENGPEWAIVMPAKGPAFEDSLAAYSAKGFRPKSVSALSPSGNEGRKDAAENVDGANTVFSAILVKDTTPAVFRRDLDRAGLLALCDSAQRNRSKCAWVDAYGSPSDIRFAAICERNDACTPWNYSYGDTESSLRGKMESFSKVWVRPTLVAPMPGGRYFTLWEENSIGRWTIEPALADSGAAASLDRESASGMHPVSLQALPGVSPPGASPSGASPSGASPAGPSAGYAVLLAEHSAPLPRRFTVTGPEAPGLEAFDEYVRNLMEANGVRAGALAVAHEGKLVLAHGYTWAEDGYPETRPNSLFRVASCSKPLTSILVHRFLKEGGAEGQGLSLKEKILSRFRALGGEDPADEPADARFREITLDQLLTHSGGWARSRENPDPVFNDYPTGSEIRKRLPASRKDFLKYMLGRPLQFAPGTMSVYDNFGYFLLGRMLESLPLAAGKTYERLADDMLFRPLGLTRPRFGGSRFEDRAPGEVLYHANIPYLQPNPDTVGTPWVAGGYGDFNLGNMDAAGAWLMSAPDYAKVLAAFDLDDGNPILGPKGVATMWGATGFQSALRGWFGMKLPLANGDTVTAKWHNGLFPGTSTLVFYRPDHWSFALFFNRDMSPQPNGRKEGLDLSRIADSVREWPQADLFPKMGIPSFPSGERTLSVRNLSGRTAKTAGDKAPGGT
jgi:N-acyl-D-amino-acid deacylase